MVLVQLREKFSWSWEETSAEEGGCGSSALCSWVILPRLQSRCQQTAALCHYYISVFPSQQCSGCYFLQPSAAVSPTMLDCEVNMGRAAQKTHVSLHNMKTHRQYLQDRRTRTVTSHSPAVHRNLSYNVHSSLLRYTHLVLLISSYMCDSSSLGSKLELSRAIVWI